MRPASHSAKKRLKNGRKHAERPSNKRARIIIIAVLSATAALVAGASSPVGAANFRSHHSPHRGTHHSVPVSSRPTPPTAPTYTSPGSTPPSSTAAGTPTSSHPSTSTSTASKPATSSAAPTSAASTPSSKPPTSSAQPAVGSGQVGCVRAPSSCGYPDASNTGVPAGTALKTVPGQVSKGTGWHWDSRGWVEIDGNGAVFSGYSVNATIDVTASNVTIRNNQITVQGDTWGIGLRHTKNVIVDHNTISSPVATGNDRLMEGLKDVYGDSSNTVVSANNIFHADTGIQIDQGVIQDNYIHDFGFKAGDHLNGTTSNSGGTPLTIRHNTILNSYSQTDAISLFQDFGGQSQRVIDDNLIAGGGYALYGGANPGGSATSNIVVTNNRFSNLYYANAGSYGPVAAFDANGKGNMFSGNVWDATGAPLNNY